MAKQEIIRTTVPAKNDWHDSDLEAKAARHGMSKSELILSAVNLFMYLTLDEVDKLMLFAEARQMSIKGIKVDYNVTLNTSLWEDNE